MVFLTHTLFKYNKYIKQLIAQAIVKKIRHFSILFSSTKIVKFKKIKIIDFEIKDNLFKLLNNLKPLKTKIIKYSAVKGIIKDKIIILKLVFKDFKFSFSTKIKFKKINIIPDKKLNINIK